MHATEKMRRLSIGLSYFSLFLHIFAITGLKTPLPIRFFNSGSWPYAQRSWITLEECQADYEITTVDLQNKSEEFVTLYRKANPLPEARAKVPLIQVGDNFLCESLVVSEYVADIYSSSLIPKDPNERSRMRLFTELCGSAFSYFPLVRAAQGEGDFEAALKTFQEGLVNANSFLASGTSASGPFCLGNEFSLAECTLAPFVQRCCAILPAFAEVDPLALCDKLKLTYLKAWIGAVLERPSVVTTGVAPDAMIASTTKMLERFAAMAKTK